jgi:hypothetical protein
MLGVFRLAEKVEHSNISQTKRGGDVSTSVQEERFSKSLIEALLGKYSPVFGELEQASR